MQQGNFEAGLDIYRVTKKNAEAVHGAGYSKGD